MHAFGWKQESSDSQSTLTNQAWSPDGLYISSGTADPMIHIFDIRHKAQKPSQSIKAHQKQVFKTVWLRIPPPRSFLCLLIINHRVLLRCWGYVFFETTVLLPSG